ncbi:MAG: D-glycero-beta-D-manno-heptose-7-phosphate kinase [Rickettsiales bacterium]|nr:D-glycero-beta-D-manno-heptose-7-phosphate kinase [Rickettsiales bacterium]
MKLRKKFKDLRILCVGDIILDTYSKGEITRISPEAPIPVLRLDEESNTIGGCGNVARNICSAGGMCHLISVIGSDEEAKILKNLLKDFKKLSFDLIVESSRCTTKKKRYVSGNQQILRVDKENVSQISGKTNQKILEKFNQLIKKCEVVVISDYNKGVLNRNLISNIIKISKQNNKIIIVDPKRKDFSIYSNADIITPNFKELLQATNFPEDSENSDKLVEKLSKTIARKYSFSNVITTRSSKGMTVMSKNKSVNLSSEAKEVFDVSGAGDTVVAYLSVELSRGKKIIHAAKIANSAASVAVGKFGTASVKRQEIKKKFEVEDKVSSLIKAKQLLKDFDDKIIGFTNGCFDLVHTGHIEFLKQARSQCDILILGLNSDSSVQKLKGKNRPIVPQNERATILENLNFVDLIIIFYELTPIKLIESLKPDIIFKGKDYKISDVVGSESIKKWNGKVKLVPLIKGNSTSNIVKRIKDGS